MNVSGSRATDDINLDEYERRLRAAGGQQASAEDPLVELARLVESSRFGISDRRHRRSPSPNPLRRARNLRPRSKSRSCGRRSTKRKISFPRRRRPIARRGKTMSSPPIRPHDANAAEQAAAERPKAWKLKVSALALAGVAMIGAVLALRGGVPGLPKQPPFIAAAQGPTKVQPPSDETVTASNDAGASLLKDNAKPASVKVVSSEEQPVDLSAQGSLGNPSAAAANPPPAADQAKPPAGARARRRSPRPSIRRSWRHRLPRRRQ